MNTIWPIMIHADKSRVGKDYCAQKIVQVLAQKGIKARQYSIARVLKALCKEWFKTHPMDDYEDSPDLRTDPIEGLGISAVTLWIKVGECFRNIDKNVWITRTVENIRNDIDIQIPVISDHRFDCEYDYLHSVFERHVSTLKINSEQGVMNASDGKVTRLPDYEITNHFDESFDRTIEVFCDEFLKNIGSNNA